MQNKIAMLADRIIELDNGLELIMMDNKTFIETNGELIGPYEHYEMLHGSELILLINITNNGRAIDVIDANKTMIVSGLNIDYRYNRPDEEQTEKLTHIMNIVDIKPSKVVPFSERVLCNVYEIEKDVQCYVAEIDLFGTKFKGMYNKELKKWVVQPGANEIDRVEDSSYLVVNYGDTQVLMDIDGKRITHKEYVNVQYITENISLVTEKGSLKKILVYSDECNDIVIDTGIRMAVACGEYIVTSKSEVLGNRLAYTYGIVHTKSKKLLVGNASYILVTQMNEAVGMVDNNVVYIVKDKVDSKPKTRNYVDTKDRHIIEVETDSGLVRFTSDGLLVNIE